ncbi:MAG: histidine phosphatase family protein [Sphingomonas sp.]|uniref:histidine phosphatase family protein n=1 Tax=Sphingomonas sp. TaxID=28214 RepID=UPI0035665026
MPSEYEIYLVRHGETEWNVAGRFQGHLDSRLTERGLAQAEGYGRQLATLEAKIDVLVASPLGRVRETTSIIRSFGRFPETEWEPRIAEVSVGSWDGLTHVDIDAQWPSRLDGTTPFDWFFRSPDGESYDSALARVTEWMDSLDGNVLAVSHGLIGRLIRGVYLNLSREETLALPVPQDVIWRLAKGRVEPIYVR